MDNKVLNDKKLESALNETEKVKTTLGDLIWAVSEAVEEDSTIADEDASAVTQLVLEDLFDLGKN